VSGTPTAATVATINAKATVAGADPATLVGLAFTRSSSPLIITCAYAEAGTASTVGGDWVIEVEYV
jgi:hypothetical protein